MDGDGLVQRTRKLSIAGNAQKQDPEKGIAVKAVSNAADLDVAKYGGGLIVHTPNPSSQDWDIDIVVIRSRKDETIKEKDQPKTKPAQKAGEKPDGHHDHEAKLGDAEPRISKEAKREVKAEFDWLTTPNMLPFALPTARIMEFPYSSEVMKQKNNAAISKLATQFLQSLEMYREPCPRRPVIYVAHEAGGEILRVAFESHVKTYLGPRFDLEDLAKSYEPFPERSPSPPLEMRYRHHGGRPPFPPPPPPGLSRASTFSSLPDASSPPSRLRRLLPRLITRRGRRRSVGSDSASPRPTSRSRSRSHSPTPRLQSPLVSPSHGVAIEQSELPPLPASTPSSPIIPDAAPQSPGPNLPGSDLPGPQSPLSGNGTTEGHRVRKSEESYNSLRSLRLQVPMFQTDSLRIVIGVVFLEYNADKERRTGFLRKLAETGIPVQWYTDKKHRARGGLPMFPADFLRILELDIPKPGSLRAFSSPNDEENYARVRTEIQTMYKYDMLLDAAYRNNIPKIESLVAERLHPDRPKANGNSPIHIAVRLNHEDAVATFLKHGSDITHKTSNGDTPLRIAAEMAYPSMVKLLLEKGAPTDIFDNGGFDFIDWAKSRRRLVAESSAEELTAEEKSNLLEVCNYLENPPLAEGPSLDGQSRKYYPRNEPPLPPSNFGTEACRAHGIIVAEFFVDNSAPEPTSPDNAKSPVANQKEFRIIKSHSVHNTLYTNILQTSAENTRQHVSNKEHQFTWYHIPSNNTAWVEGLFVRLGIQDWLEIDTQEHRGRTPHSRVMMAGNNKLDNNKNEGNISFFAPYLSVELSSNQKRMARWIRTAGNRFRRDRDFFGRPGFQAPLPPRNSPDKDLIQAYLNEHRGLHIRRTLDQSHYSMLPNTKERDKGRNSLQSWGIHQDYVNRYEKDQVLNRHRDGGPPAVVMVDQLWLWVIDDILITSFPMKLDYGGATGRDVLDNILQYVRSNDRKPILSPHGLADLIIEKCTGVLSATSDNLNSPYNVLDVFGSAIGKVSNEETGLMKQFHANVLKLAKLRAPKKKRTYKYNHFDDTSEYSSNSSVPTDVSSSSSSDSASSRFGANSSYRTRSSASYRIRLRRHQREARKDPQKLSTRLLNSFNNIAKETTQLIEIKDIKDELGMLIEVLTAQQQAIEAFSSSTSTFVQKDVLPRTVAVGREQLQRLKQMSEQSGEIFQALNHLLDLKQKQANASEARTANVQAMQADKQGKTLMVFTTVTIIFLPLSFMAAFFAMPVANFPKKSDGTSAMTLGFVSKFIFPISIAISIPFLILAFSVNTIENSISTFQRRANAAALTKARWNRRVIEDLTGWQRHKTQLIWFFIGLWRWFRAMIRPSRKVKNFFRKFGWRGIKWRAKKLRRKARRKGLWRRKRGSDGVVTDSSSGSSSGYLRDD